jgi:hypothetical protein
MFNKLWAARGTKMHMNDESENFNKWANFFVQFHRGRRQKSNFKRNYNRVNNRCTPSKLTC